ncbi:enoyl-CoA hydratase/isomerase family protein [Pseudonocardia eucalypti]|uniref:Enoyl-CoA hydratase/isomerase family protein n=1 Tax=Pseudonocardia eucalypti TaxID=648755 RepID=A0ABP9PGY2_9PSEU|nr:enoyl-CoA hydratase [Pseudonocardia eucalypti]
MTYRTLAITRFENHPGVAELRLTRPEVMNRFDAAMHVELTEAMASLADDPSVLAVLLTAEGKFFSAGGDTELMLSAAADPTRRMQLIDEGRRLFYAFADFTKPLVVALHGDTYGLGATVVLLGDAVVTAPDVKIADTHVRMALVAGDGGAVVWPANMPLARAKRHLLTGDPMTGADAHALGIVSDLVASRDEVYDAALALAVRLAELPPLAVQYTKRALNRHLALRGNEVLDLAFYLEGATMTSQDMLEAIDAFKNKRPPKFTGR